MRLEKTLVGFGQSQAPGCGMMLNEPTPNDIECSDMFSTDADSAQRVTGCIYVSLDTHYRQKSAVRPTYNLIRGMTFAVWRRGRILKL